MTGYRRREQLEAFPETIEQELRPAVCERRLTDRQTDIHKDNYSIDECCDGIVLIIVVYKDAIYYIRISNLI